MKDVKKDVKQSKLNKHETGSTVKETMLISFQHKNQKYLLTFKQNLHLFLVLQRKQKVHRKLKITERILNITIQIDSIQNFSDRDACYSRSRSCNLNPMYRKKGTKEMKFAMRNSQRFNAINAVPITQYCLFALTFLLTR